MVLLADGCHPAELLRADDAIWTAFFLTPPEVVGPLADTAIFCQIAPVSGADDTGNRLACNSDKVPLSAKHNWGFFILTFLFPFLLPNTTYNAEPRSLQQVIYLLDGKLNTSKHDVHRSFFIPFTEYRRCKKFFRISAAYASQERRILPFSGYRADTFSDQACHYIWH